MAYRRVALIGFSGAGKSTVGRELSRRLDWQLLDLDAEIERQEGRSIPDIFRASGESAFRAIERQVLIDALKCSEVVIATGGGAVVGEAAWHGSALGDEETLTVLLEAAPDVLLARLQDQQAQDPAGAERPMLAGAEPLARIRALKAEREPWYRRAKVVVPVEERPVGHIVEHIAAAADPHGETIALDVPGASSRIDVGRGVLDTLGDRIAERWPGARRVWIVADQSVAGYHLDRVVRAASGCDAVAETLTFPPGEASKSMSGLSALYDGFLGGAIERSDVIVALGGGVAGDLVGFAAATVLRGVGLVQVPTTLLAMVDSSVGGKTGINHSAGKNLIGAFYQPSVVIVDPDLLETLPEREYRSGWAEIIKHGLIEPSTPAGDSGLFQLVSANAETLRDRTSPLLGHVIARNVEIKASVVRADEREAGLRAILNFGHTLGHAVEAAGYQLLHGEAIAVGMHGAMRIGVALGSVSEQQASMVVAVLQRFGLPTTVAANIHDVRQMMRSDKKRVGGEQQWIVPDARGGVTIERAVPDAAVETALEAVITAERRMT
jgi:shikimate kinase / 3-dehydroquinate synthase